MKWKFWDLGFETSTVVLRDWTPLKDLLRFDTALGNKPDREKYEIILSKNCFYRGRFKARSRSAYNWLVARSIGVRDLEISTAAADFDFIFEMRIMQFLETVDLTLNSLHKRIESYENQPNASKFTRVNMHGTYIGTDALFMILNSCRLLTEMTVTGLYETDEKPLVRAPQCKLRKIQFNKCLLDDKSLLQMIEHQDQVLEFGVSECSVITNKILEEIPLLMRNLEGLSVSNCENIDENGYASFLKSAGPFMSSICIDPMTTSIEALLAKTDRAFRKVTLCSISPLKRPAGNLHHYYGGYNYLPNSEVLNTFFSRCAAALESLSIVQKKQRYHVPNMAIAPHAIANMQNLRCLRLSECDFGADLMSALKTHCKQLEMITLLNMRSKVIDAKAWEDLLHACSKLHTVQLWEHDGFSITRPTIVALATQCSSLTSVDLTLNSAVSGEPMLMLVENCPTLKKLTARGDASNFNKMLPKILQANRNLVIDKIADRCPPHEFLLGF